jgi:hypothetical protein
VNGLKLALRKSIPVVLPFFFLINLMSFAFSPLYFILPWPLGYGVTKVMDGIVFWILGVGYIGASGCTSRLCSEAAIAYFDLVTLLMLGIFFWGVMRVSSRLRALQVASLTVTLLPIEVFFFDNREFGVTATSVQTILNFMPWFTNADLLIVTSAVFVAATVMIWRRKSEVLTRPARP